MKIIITESQFEQIIPNSVRRRLSEISDVLYEMLNNTDIGEEAQEYPEDDYVDYVIEILLPEVISEIDWSDRISVTASVKLAGDAPLSA